MADAFPPLEEVVVTSGDDEGGHYFITEATGEHVVRAKYYKDTENQPKSVKVAFDELESNPPEEVTEVEPASNPLAEFEVT